MTTEPVFTEDEWNAAMPQLTADMQAYLRPYRTPIFEDFGDHAKGWGSGSFLRLGDRVFILTNEHVARARREHRALVQQFDGQEDLRLIIGDHADFPAPLDLAVLPVNEDAWNNTAHNSQAIEIDQIALAHAPFPTEVLAFSGFSGDNVKFYWDTVIAKGTCYLASEASLPNDDRFDNRYHFGIDYRPDLSTSIAGSADLPLPPGLSGSTVWNTGFVEAKLRGVPWTPDCARVTGVVWGWPSNHGCLLATRAEYLRSFLLGVPSNL